MTQTQERSRTFTWSDPVAGAAHIGRSSGLELLRAMIAGELAAPPVMHLLDMTRMEADEGRVAVELVPQEFHYNPLGTVHGGVLATLMDTAMGSAVFTRLGDGIAYTTLELKLNFIRPVTLDGSRLTCDAEVVHLGRRTATAEGKITDANGKLIAHGSTTILVLHPGS